MKIEEIEVGKEVIFWDENEYGKRNKPFRTFILSIPYEKEKHMVVDLINHSSIPIKYIDKITAGSLMAAKICGLESITNEDITNEIRSFYGSKGININI